MSVPEPIVHLPVDATATSHATVATSLATSLVAGSGSFHLSVKSHEEQPKPLFSDPPGSGKLPLEGTVPSGLDEDKKGKKQEKEREPRSRNSSYNVKRRRPVVAGAQLQKIPSWKGTEGLLLDDEPYFHGFMAREEAERLVTKHGEFLVRKTEVKSEECTVVTVRWFGDIKHLRVQTTKHRKNVWMHELCFESIPDLIRHHEQTRHPVHKMGIQLISHVKREQWQLYHEQITLGKKLGSGEFGEVLAGSLTLGLFSKSVPVAVKTLKAGKLSGDDRVTFLREANVMLKLHHKHVIRLYGVATQQEPIMIVMEVAPGGSLLERVRKEDSPSLETKRKYCRQVISGMAYLEEQQVIHRDLAARNCLINGHDECKISDFGLSLLGKLHREKKMLKVPVRWLAPETLSSGLFSSKSDVWSCGVVIFEVFSDGATPYSEYTALREVRRKVMRDGLRLESPAAMPPADAQIMRLCFETDPELRYSFAALKTKYSSLSPEGVFPRLSSLFHK